jgi:hypothetical protein
MTDSPRSGSPYDPTDPYGNPYPAYSDPAYAGTSPYGPTYGAPPPSSGPAPTEQLPPYWTQVYGQVPPGLPPQEPPPEPPKTPRWLWVAAGLVVLVVAGLVAALIITNTSSSRQTVVAPIPALPEPNTTTRTSPPTATASPTPMFPLPIPTLPTPTESTTPGVTEPVVYDVSGSGRAINITYVDTGSVMQTEFNVVLPWHKEVSLAKPASSSASVTVINIGRDITCTVTVGGVQVRQRTGTGLTICSGAGG